MQQDYWLEQTSRQRTHIVDDQRTQADKLITFRVAKIALQAKNARRGAMPPARSF